MSRQFDELQEYHKVKHNADVHLRNSKLNYAIIRAGTLNNKKDKRKIDLVEHLNKQGKISRADFA